MGKFPGPGPAEPLCEIQDLTNNTITKKANPSFQTIFQQHFKVFFFFLYLPYLQAVEKEI
jgi:hypothetical protein